VGELGGKNNIIQLSGCWYRAFSRDLISKVTIRMRIREIQNKIKFYVVI